MKRTWARCASCWAATYVCAKRGCKPSAKVQKQQEKMIREAEAAAKAKGGR